LPTVYNDADIAYACWKNTERVSIHASTFQKHIGNFSSAESNYDPADHTVVLEADIRQPPDKNQRKRKLQLGWPIACLSRIGITKQALCKV
jgi:hypothetical protein